MESCEHLPSFSFASITTDASRDATLDACGPERERQIWREFRRQGARGQTEIFIVGVEPDGRGYRIRRGRLGGEITESAIFEPGPEGRPGSPTWLSAEENCRLKVQARIHQICSQAKPFLEYIDGQLISPPETEVSFAQRLSRAFRTPKPTTVISQEHFRELCRENRARITRKYDGIGLTLVHHTFGWEIYTLAGNRITPLFPKQIEELQKHPEFGVGTILKAEGVIFSEQDSTRENFALMNATYKSSRNWQSVRRLVDEKPELEASFVFYDILYKDSLPLNNMPYDERAREWTGFPVARGGNGPLLSAEFYPQVTPDNWREWQKRMNFEGFVVVDGASGLGSKILSTTDAPRLDGMFKLKPAFEEDVVIYAIRMDPDGRMEPDEYNTESARYRSVFIKQRFPEFYPGTRMKHPRAGEWFSAGRVSIKQSPEVRRVLKGLVEERKILTVNSISEGEALDIDNTEGVAVAVEFQERFPSQKLRHAVFGNPPRFRCDSTSGDYKAPADCVAQILGTPAPLRGKK